MKKEKKPEQFITKPIYPGGFDALKKFVSEQLVYPEEALAHKIQGTVKVAYDIDHKGKVIKTKVIKSVGYGCDEEALRIVRLLKFKVKNPRRGKIVYHKTINIHFRLKEPLEEKVPITYSYSYTTHTDEQHSNNYVYTWTQKKSHQN